LAGEREKDGISRKDTAVSKGENKTSASQRALGLRLSHLEGASTPPRT